MSRESKATKDEIQRNRNEAYQGGWDDGYAEGFAKAVAGLVEAFPAHTAYGRGVRCAISNKAAAIRRTAEGEKT